jgi:hypothetical protein
VGKSILIKVLLLTVIITSVGCNNSQQKVLSVRDVQTNEQQARNPVTIIGVVLSVSVDNPKEFALIDLDEASAGKPGREIFYLPVVSKSRAPKAGAVVKVTGIVMDHGLYVAATKVKRWKLDPSTKPKG